MLENIVLDIVEKGRTINAVSHANHIESRDYFLFFIFAQLADLSNENVAFDLSNVITDHDLKYFVNHIIEISSKENPNSAIKQAIHNFLGTSFRLSKKAIPLEVFQSLTKSEKNKVNRGLDFQLSTIADLSDTPLILKILPHIENTLVAVNKIIIKELMSIESLIQIESMSTIDATLIYSRVLKRLQATDHPEQISSKFIYDEIPSDFTDIIMEIGAFDDIESVYSPYDVTVEQSLYLALDFPEKEYRVECLLDSDRHIFRKFGLAQAQNLLSTQTHCLSDNSIINKNYFDVSICLLQPKTKKDSISGKPKEEGYSTKVVYKEHLYINRMLESLNESGKGYVITGKGPLFRKRDLEYRATLIESNLVDAVITLPAGILKFCPIPLEMTVLNKAKKTDDVLFINATEFQSEYGRRVVLENTERIAEEYRVRQDSSTFGFTVPNETIAKNNYSLNSLNYMKIRRCSTDYSV